MDIVLLVRYTEVDLYNASLSSGVLISRKWLTSAICIPTSYIFYWISLIDNASSKSLADYESIVNTISLVKSTLFSFSASGIINSFVFGSKYSSSYFNY